MNKWIETARNNLLIHSDEKTDYNLAKSEWYFNGVVIDNHEDLSYDEDRPSCELCEHENLRWQFRIENTLNDNFLYVGSTCIKQFDIKLIDNFGNEIFGTERDSEVNKIIRNSIKNIHHENVLQALRKLWKIDDPDRRPIIENAAKQWKEDKSFSPKMLSFLVWRFKQNSIDFNSLNLKISIKKKIHKDQLIELEEWQYEHIHPFLSKAQQKKI